MPARPSVVRSTESETESRSERRQTYQEQPSDNEDVYTGDPVYVRGPVAVRFIEITEVEFDDDPVDGLALRFRVETPNETEFWQHADDLKPQLIKWISETVRDKSEGALTVKEIQLRRGSIEILVILVFVKTWLVSHATLLGALASLLQLYKPAKKLVKYAIKTIRPLLIDLARWFKNLLDGTGPEYA